MDFMTATATQELLGVSRQERQKLVACGVIEPSGHFGTAEMYPRAAIEALAASATWKPSAPAVAVRLGAPTQDDDRTWREWMGWHESWPEPTKRDAARGVWELRHGARLIDERATLVAVVSVVVVGAWSITGGTYDDHEARWRFDVTDHPKAPEILGPLGERRILRLGRGPFTKTWI